MKILLANPPGPYCRAGSRWSHVRKERGLDYNPFPFSLAYATSVLLKKGYEADIKDCIALDWNETKFFNYVKDFNPNIVVIETSTPSYYFDLKIVKKLKNLGIKTVGVGSHVSVFPEKALKDGYDHIIVGEYEFAVPKIIKRKRFIIKSKLIKNLDYLPPPSWDLMPMNKYNEPVCDGRNVTVMSSRGCPFRCSFCLNSVFYGYPNFRKRKISNVIKEVKLLIEKYNPDEIYFDDDTINADKNHLTSLCKEMKKLDISWACMGTGKISEKLIKFMAESGCKVYKFGVESSDEKVLNNIPKVANTEDVKNTVKYCRKYGIKTHATYVIGLPFSTLETARKTIDFALKLNTNTLQFSMAVPYPGTRFYKMAEKNGWLLTKDWSKYNANVTSPVSYQNFRKKDIERIYLDAWTKWNRHIALKKPKTIFHHLYGVYRREGFFATCKFFGWGIKRIITGVK